MRRLFHLACLCLAGVFANSSAQQLSQPTPTGRVFEGRASIADDQGEGRRLMQSLIGAPPSADSLLYGTFIVRDANDKRLEIPVRWLVKVEGEDVWHDVFETRPVVGLPAQRMVVTHKAGQTNSYSLTVGEPSGEFPPPKSLAGTNIFQPFARSDFWIADLGLDFYHWPEARIIKTEMRKGRSCRVVECVNPAPSPGTYSKVLCWIDYESGGLVRAEAFDAANKRLKEFSVRKVSRVNGRAQLREIEMRNDQTDSITVLEFEYEFEDAQRAP